MNEEQKYSRKTSISDLPLELSSDDFGTDKYVKGLVRFIERSAAPITIALKGEWGSGKTSLMNRLYNDLCGENNNFIGIKINTWEYSMLATPEETVVRIILQLVKSLSNNDPTTTEKLKKFAQSAVNFIFRGARELTKVQIPGAGILMESMGVPTEIFSGQENQSNISLSELREDLTVAIDKSLKETGKDGIIIFVDDLDRLNPPLAVQILELLKNIFTLKHCIFILAIDYDVVVKGLEPKFGPYKPENDREFRSFFDKIIQVPFSLPVGNYQPLKFVLDSLIEIEFITARERSMTRIRESIERIVNYSVGKNPRAIKRLINTLSLLDCISKCSQEQVNDSPDYKLINFAIVSLQVCYQKIYDMLSINPDFDKWDADIAAKLNLHITQDDDSKFNEMNGDIILNALCEKEIFYEQHHSDIIGLLHIIKECAKEIDSKNSAKIVQDILRNSSITNVSASETGEFSRKEIINKLHNNVWNYLSKHRPEMRSQFKRNTGNGGYFIYLKDDSYFQVVFTPNEDNGLSLGIWINVKNGRPDRLADLPYADVVADPAVLNVIDPLRKIVSELTAARLLHPEKIGGEIHTDIVEEYKKRDGELWDSISGDLNYKVEVKSVSDYEDTRIIRTIGDLIIGAYDLNNRALDIE